MKHIHTFESFVNESANLEPVNSAMLTPEQIKKLKTKVGFKNNKAGHPANGMEISSNGEVKATGQYAEIIFPKFLASINYKK
jgi:hypothetical protein